MKYLYAYRIPTQHPRDMIMAFRVEHIISLEPQVQIMNMALQREENWDVPVRHKSWPAEHRLQQSGSSDRQLSGRRVFAKTAT
ncbi:hypothetical protein E2C01_085365 [Portunus trituberculatus]|uniref:Uncharacterized protein n=1 Tax=Portunus trituberculatus TaxID=210409 RepID=A0A5B7J7E6_PORTR|nr:hypothetical protein [Portunus trituberculatus]